MRSMPEPNDAIDQDEPILLSEGEESEQVETPKVSEPSILANYYTQYVRCNANENSSS